MILSIKQKQAANAEQAVVISADKSVRYEEVIKVMDALHHWTGGVGREQLKRLG